MAPGIRRFSNKKDAVSFGSEMSRRGQTNLYVHNRDGEVQEVNRFGDPPTSPNGHVHENEP